MKSARHIHRLRRGFTLVELMISMFIFALVITGLFRFSYMANNMLFDSIGKIDINRDVRVFTQLMSNHARAANEFYIYPSFNSYDRDEIADRARADQTGDFLLLIYQEPWPDLDSPEHITKLIGYFRRSEGADGTGPVMRFEINYAEGDYKDTTEVTPEELLSGLDADGDYERVWELSRGLADGNLFYNFYDRSIMIKAELFRGNRARRITETYNFTVSPRG
jgi:prepilin-type N-terminal cleavage/methylation domain-containing protein